MLSTRRWVIAIMALVVPLAFTATSANAGTAGYLYVDDADTTSTTEANVNLPINAQTVSDAKLDEHSLFEMSMSNMWGASGNIIEIGVTTDLGLNGNSNPHWFVYSWINGTGQGYDASSHFVSQIGSFWATSLTSLEGTSEEAEFQYKAPNWDLDLNGTAAGYFPGTEWSGAFTSSSVTQVFGEVYYDGTFYPTLNGTVSGYRSSGGGHLSTNVVDAPYAQSNASQTGFTASGPLLPEPSSVVLLGIAPLAFAWRHRAKV
ncbi:MAG: PEP-CTERM sorting domain-containing protein [Tepidisphaeraceae bacterium]